MLIFYSNYGGLVAHYCCRLLSGINQKISCTPAGKLVSWQSVDCRCHSMCYHHDRENLARTLAGILAVSGADITDVYLIDCNILLPRWLAIIWRIAPENGSTLLINYLNTRQQLVDTFLDQCRRLAA